MQNSPTTRVPTAYAFPSRLGDPALFVQIMQVVSTSWPPQLIFHGVAGVAAAPITDIANEAQVQSCPQQIRGPQESIAESMGRPQDSDPRRWNRLTCFTLLEVLYVVSRSGPADCDSEGGWCHSGHSTRVDASRISKGTVSLGMSRDRQREQI